MKKQILIIIMAAGMLAISPNAIGQIVISDNGSTTADAASVLDVQSTSRGFLFPRMTEAQRNAIASPPTSMIIYQTNNTPGVYINTGTAATPDWQEITDATHIGGYWTPTGSDLYYNDGNVGIGTNAPDELFHVSGRPGTIMVDAETNYDAGIHFGYEGSSLFNLFTWGASTTNPYIFFGSDSYNQVWGMRPTGRVWHDYQGTSAAAYVLNSGAPKVSFSLLNSASTIRNISYGIQVSLPNIPTTTLDTVPAGITVFIGGDGTAIYAENSNHSNRGWMGTEYRGVSGKHGTSDNLGSLGLADFGVQGTNDASTYWGAIGTSNAGVYARLTPDGSSQSLSANDFAVKGVGVELAPGGTNRGSNYSNQVGGVMGYNTEGTEYSAGVWGMTDETDADERTSGVWGGIENASEWGALGYEDSGGTEYGGYFTTQTTGSGKAMGEASSSIGIGVYGDLFGAHVDGEVYGLYATGENYGIYSDGDVYRTGADVHIQQDNNGQNQVMYTLVSPEMTVQTYGIGQLVNGKSNINFDDAFAGIVSDSEPIIVTITPIGESKGVHLQMVDGKGFAVVENSQGKSSVQFSWIAIGKRAGYENKSLPADVIASDYNTKIQTGLHNDADMSTDGQGLSYQNGNLSVGQVQKSANSANVGSSTEVALERNDISENENTAMPAKKYAETEDVPIKK